MALLVLGLVSVFSVSAAVREGERKRELAFQQCGFEWAEWSIGVTSRYTFVVLHLLPVNLDLVFFFVQFYCCFPPQGCGSLYFLLGI